MNWPSVTIAICTYNRKTELVKCLNSISECAKRSGLRPRVLLVDNFGNVDGKELSYPQIDLSTVHEPVTGLAHARNRVIHECNDDWIFFLDDDAWLDRERNSLQVIADLLATDIEADVIAAHVEGKFPEGTARWLKSEYYHPKPFSSEFSDLEGGWIQGGAALYRLQWLQVLGGFDETLGMSGEEIAYGEDTLLEKRLRERGARLKFHPDIIVCHRIQYQSLRSVLSSFYKRTLTYYLIYEERAIHQTYRSIVSCVLSSIWVLVKYVFRFGKKYQLRNYLIDVLQPLIKARVIWKIGGPQWFRKWRMEYQRDQEVLSVVMRKFSSRNSSVRFVQLGGCDGVSFDPVREFIDQYKWEGVIVEPISKHVEKLEELYKDNPGVVIEASALGSSDEEVEIFFPGDAHDLPDWAIGVATMRPDRTSLNPLLDTTKLVSTDIISEKVPAMTWASLMEKYNLNHIDILVMDIEGMEFEVLQQIDDLPGVIVMEYSNLPANEFSQFRTKFRSSGFVMIKYTSTDLIAVRKDLLGLQERASINLPLRNV